MFFMFAHIRQTTDIKINLAIQTCVLIYFIIVFLGQHLVTVGRPASPC